jgi:2-amino-4-hydroxy-6-hydroxymethyldihydropteridine diphosphokinase
MGNKKDYIAKATQALNQRVGKVISVSKYYETAAWGNTEQEDFLNIALELKSTLSPQETLDIVLDIEKTMGRERAEKWAARTIDIDILLYDDLVLNTDTLTIPHPHLHERNFVLIPLMEIAPEVIHPILNEPIDEIYMACLDECDVTMLD